jgi:hypothetical protein
MGYSVFITRRKHWHDASGKSISIEEWRALVEADAELQWSADLGGNAAVWRSDPGSDPEWIDAEDGHLFTKNPSTALLGKLACIAESLRARVVGEEGESYDRDGVAMPAPGPTIADRIRSFFANLKAGLQPSIAPAPAFAVGARVRGVRGRIGTVTRIDLRAEHGMGRIDVLFDNGRIESFSAIAHGLKALSSNGD